MQALRLQLAPKMPDDTVAEIPPIVVDVPHGSMGVGDVTGPLGIVLAVVLGLDRFGLLRKGSDRGSEGAAVAPHHRDEFVELRADVRHLQQRITEIREEASTERQRAISTLESIRDDLRREIDRTK